MLFRSTVGLGVCFQPGVQQQGGFLLSNFHDVIGSLKIDAIEDFMCQNLAVINEKGSKIRN